MKNKSLNFPSQGTAADMMKYAGILIFRYLIKQGKAKQNNQAFKNKTY